MSLTSLKFATLATCLFLSPSIAASEQIGNVDVDWLGNDILIEAFEDPEVKGDMPRRLF